jgi:hypothetical protein
MEEENICKHKRKIISDIIKRRDGTSYKYSICSNCGFRNLIEINPRYVYCVIS